MTAAPELTQREREVLEELVHPVTDAGEAFTEAASVKVIAQRLFVSEAAVKQHLLRLYDKFEIYDDVPGRRRVRLANEVLKRGALGAGTVVRELEPARGAYARRAWGAAADAFARAHAADPLPPANLLMWGAAAMWSDRHSACVAAWERAYACSVREGDAVGEAEAAIGLALSGMVRQNFAVVGGWVATAKRALGTLADVTVAHADLAALEAIAAAADGDPDRALGSARVARETGAATDNADAQALGMVMEGFACTRLGRVEEGVALLDEAMTFAGFHALGPLATGVVYCRTIVACIGLWDYRRASEWTDEAERRQSRGEDGLAGDCLTHRAALRFVRGEWDEAERDAEAACTAAQLFDLNHVAEAIYSIGEIKLRRGELEAAELRFRQAAEMAHPAQPGLSLLLMARGDVESAEASIGAALRGVPAKDPLTRAALLPARVSIAIAAGDAETAGVYATELDGVAERFGTPALRAAAAAAAGTVELSRAQHTRALASWRAASNGWAEAGAPYESARARVGVARALTALGDRGGAAIELEVASATFERLGARPDLDAAADLLDV
jgi:ATP/maltotriose-dependent transcriptional regulator MalT